MAEKTWDGTRIIPSQIITCPHCGRQYLAGEVLYADDVVGVPTTTIIRDAIGHILYAEYEEDSEPKETSKYICDSCNKPFIIRIEPKYTTEKEEEALDFSEEYVSLL